MNLPLVAKFPPAGYPFVVDAQDVVVAHTGAFIATEEQKEHARFIARACNSHKDLLAACKEFVRKCECGEASSWRSYAQMKAAIAKAEGAK